MAVPKTVALVMAGGSGTRFWPLSRKALPKQYIAFGRERSLIQQTVDRLAPLVPAQAVFVCAHESHAPILRDQLPNIGDRFLEPQGRNTTACLMFSLALLEKRGFSPNTRMIALPADHYIEDAEQFRRLLVLALDSASSSGALVTLGIVPSRPHTGYGYIEAGEGRSGAVLAVKRFVEKPSLATATEFLNSSQFFWNSGIFIWTLNSLATAFEAHSPKDWQRIQTAVAKNTVPQVYDEVASVPIDVSVMEKAKNVLVIPADNIGWTDLGSWNALYEMEATARGMNVTLAGRTKAVQSEGCLVRTPGKKVALVGVKDLVIVEEGDTILIAHRDFDQLVREASKEFDP
ncbi:MAG: mannose-1-phosphate guanylyltransferase [Deltaproteobacteria bacterium]|nr:mannose-1-phosphate guanylyltransferase [Deltaproteobacteria bacterium]MBI3295236.1 mannose-1-phosphate guanylyltransferase [Deltaproteobacteria bacterium]